MTATPSMPDPGAPAPASIPVPSAPVALARRVAIAATLALVVLGIAWEAWLAPTGRGTLVVKVLPLVAALPGLWRHRMYTYRWLSLLVWLYVLEGLVRATSDVGVSAVLAALEVVLAMLVFVATTFYIRRRQSDGAAAAAQTP